MEEIVEVVAADAKLVLRAIGVAHRGQEATLESVERLLFLVREVAVPGKPVFGRGADFLAMAVLSKLEGAVRDEVGDDDLVRGGRGLGTTGDWYRHSETTD